MADEAGEANRNRLKKVQEKNKRAQARYRQKQKEKMQGFEGQCLALSEELETLKQAYTKLEDENSNLQVSLKDPAVFLAQRGRQLSHDDAGPSSQHDQAPIPVRPIPQQSTGWDQGAYDTFFRDLICKTFGEKQAKDCEKQCEYRPPEAILSILTNITEELRERLKFMEDRTSSQGEAPVVELVHALRQASDTYRDKIPPLQTAVDRLAMKDKVSSAYGPARADVWKSVLEAMRLGQAQLKRILELRVGFLAKMDVLIKQRKDIVWELQQTTVMCNDACKRDENFSRAVKLFEQLQDSLAQEHTAREDLQKAICQHVLTEVQEARAIVTAHPYQVDMAAFCDTVASRPDIVASCLGVDQLAENARGMSLPAILQIPAVLDSDTHVTPEMYMQAMSAWQNAESKSGIRLAESRPLIHPFLPTVTRPQATQAFASSNPLQFNGGGKGSGFLPMQRQGTATAKDSF